MESVVEGGGNYPPKFLNTHLETRIYVTVIMRKVPGGGRCWDDDRCRISSSFGEGSPFNLISKGPLSN